MSLLGQQLGKYQLEQLLGSGGMGEVYLATDTLIHRQVAIKVMRSEISGYPDPDATKEASRLFQREVKAITTLDHPHILPLYDYGEEHTQGGIVTYMVMPLRQEGTLTDWLRDRASRGLLSPLDVVQLISQAANALQYAHDRQIIHQDVKPSNFLIRRDDQNPNMPYLLLSDFGVARFTSVTTGVSQAIRGTPVYMAPELWEGQSVPATDQYALAVMAYELLTGRSPFQGGLTQMMYQHVNTAPQPPSALNPYLSNEIDQVLLIALAKKSADRFHSVTAFANALQNAVQLLDSTALRSIQQMPPSQNVYATLAISQDEAQQGSSRVLSLSDGRRISVSIPAGIHDGQVLYLDSQGRLSVKPEKEGAIILSVAVMSTVKQNGSITNEPTVIQPPPPPSAGPFAPPANAGGDHRQAPPVPLYAQQPYDPTLFASPARREAYKRTSPTLAILLVVLIILVVAGGLLYFTRPLWQGGSATSGTPTVGPSSATATQATATSVPTSTTVPNPYINPSGPIIFNDPLADNLQGHKWYQGSNSIHASCSFVNAAYQSYQPNSGYFHSCMEQAVDFTNFVFEVKATLLSGDYEGMVFRVNPANTNQYYFFAVYTNGSYILRLSKDANWADTTIIQQGNSPYIFLSPNQTNVLAVVADGSNLQLYINDHQLTAVTDPTLTHGWIGMFAGNETTNAVVDFQDAKVWQL